MFDLIGNGRGEAGGVEGLLGRMEVGGGKWVIQLHLRIGSIYSCMLKIAHNVKDTKIYAKFLIYFLDPPPS